jgi:predicted metal-dependent hydrolase
MVVHIDRIIHSKRKTIALMVESDGWIVVRAPLRMTGQAILQFVERHADWVEMRLAEIRSAAPVPPQQYQPGQNFLYLGREYPLEIVPDQQKKLVLEDRFKLAGSDLKSAELAFQQWYRQRAGLIIPERVLFYANKYAFQYRSVTISSARTRWGSCSSKGVLSFSWRLILTPIELVDYVVVHELAHTVQHNHSKKFWNLVEEIFPDYKERRRRLRQFGEQVQS